jgi:MinD superfamily P-loop ATPase
MPQVIKAMQNWALPEIDLNFCDRCGECVANSVEMGPQGPFFVRAGDCTYCAVCETICPQGAITCLYEIVWETED